MSRDPQPDLDGKKRVHAVAGLILLLVIVAFLVIFIATNWQRSPDGGGGFLGSETGSGCPPCIHGYHLVERSRFVPRAAAPTPAPEWKLSARARAVSPSDDAARESKS